MGTWIAAAWRDGRAWWRGPAGADGRRLAIFGALLIASGLAHVGVWAAAGLPSLEGPVSWRKPIVFGLSTGALTFSLAWVVSLLPATRGRARQVWAYIALLGAEIALIDVQRWRGVGSHFNTATPLDAAVFQLMGLLILVVAGIIAGWTIILARRGAAAPEARLAALAGLLLVSIGNLIGIGLSVYGSMQAQAGVPPHVVGAAGNLKVPHALALHGIQVLPLLAWALLDRVPGTRRRQALLRLGVAGYAGLTGWAMAQTLAGRAPLDVTPVGAIVLAASLVALAWPALTAAAARPAPLQGAAMRSPGQAPPERSVML